MILLYFICRNKSYGICLDIMQNYGKIFENNFRSDWLRTFPDSFILRLPDQLSGYKYTSSNICDFITYYNNILFLIECKSHKGASLPFNNITQYDKMKQYTGILGVRTGVVLWLIDKDVILYVPISTITQMKAEGKKSVGLKALKEGYNIKIIPSVKKRVFMRSDYSILLSLEEGE